MFLKKIVLNQYGPISGQDMDIGKGIQIIWGPNEAGKTLTIDAMLKLMLGKTVKDFENIDRVDHMPEGYLLIEDYQGQQLKIGTDKSLSQHMGLNPQDARNILAIRNSDLTINLEEEYYRTVTDRLTGLQTERIESMVDMFRQYGRLTDQGSLSNRKEYGNIKENRERAEQLAGNLNSYMARAREEELDELELQKLKLSEELKQAKQAVAYSEKQLAYNDFKQIEGNLEQLSDLVKNYRQYKKYSHEDYNRLIKLESEMDAAETSIKASSSEAEALGRAITDIKGKKADVEGKVKPYADKWSVVDNLKQELTGLQKQKQVSPARLLMWVSFALLLLAGLSIVPLALHQNLTYLWLSLSFSVMFLAFFLPYFYRWSKFRAYKVRVEGLLNEFANLGFKAHDLKEVASSVSRFVDEKKSLEESKTKLEQELEVESRQRQRIIEEIGRNNKLISDHKQEMADILNQVGAENITGLSKCLDEKKDLQHRGKQIYLWLGKELGMEPDPDLSMDELEKKLPIMQELALNRRPEDYSSTRVDQDIDREQYQQKKQQLLQLEEQLEQIGQKLSDHQERLRDFQKRLNQLDIDQILELDSLSKVPRAETFLEEFIQDIDRRFEVAVKAISIFEQISSEEQLKVSDIFGTLSASDYFKQITGQRYNRIYYDSAQKRVKVVNRDESILDAVQLSRGTYDQLYLAIRVALAQKVLPEPCFFILDDAFIYSDKTRLSQQFEVLAQLAEKGWSFIYFTVKEEVKEAAEQFSDNKLICMEESR
ncbi:MAG: AAA family ATPase [Actinomycetia bacterium]|nr:AAA family ATPase [Actinomycetes bacterium]